ncbi:hypothetical protein FE783_37070 [Paenibacillus mesophilus]|uniref:hypothetical protein n=1 Tax=Paenibacillus mesophilus TaxID=2582849 RepID=UPI00110E57F5|nr:hypothetical protein [Paenibacillus mesophilus]TMV42653.1 hypothetical protein FE783_37070 [Paenibacillus mesophilus]
MKTLIQFQNKLIPVYVINATSQKSFKVLLQTLETKFETGKSAMKKCLASLISIEIDGGEAILHSFREEDSLALSLY